MNPSNLKCAPKLLVPVAKRRAEVSASDSYVFLIEQLSTLPSRITGKVAATELLRIIKAQLAKTTPDKLDLLIADIQKYLKDGSLSFSIGVDAAVISSKLVELEALSFSLSSMESKDSVGTKSFFGANTAEPVSSAAKDQGSVHSSPSEKIKVLPGGEKYEGDLLDNRSHGQGIMTFPGGDKYSGAWKADKKHGRGVYTFANGASYSGEWRADKMYGSGVYVYKNGCRYEGGWKSNHKHGQGIMTYANGARYVGSFEADQRHGTGIYTLADGAGYAGNWRDDKMHGTGVYTYTNGGRYEGGWELNQKHGHGIMIYPDGVKYVGKWVANRKDGKGILLYSDGAQYECEWKADKMHGTAIYTATNGAKISWVWTHGVSIEFEKNCMREFLLSTDPFWLQLLGINYISGNSARVTQARADYQHYRENSIKLADLQLIKAIINPLTLKAYPPDELVLVVEHKTAGIAQVQDHPVAQGDPVAPGHQEVRVETLEIIALDYLLGKITVNLKNLMLGEGGAIRDYNLSASSGINIRENLHLFQAGVPDKSEK